jgi:hypothetical protein
MNVTRTNPSMAGLGCACGDEGDCMCTPYGNGARGAALPGIGSSMFVMPWGASSPTLVNPSPPVGGPTANSPSSWAGNDGYPAAINTPGTVANTLAQTSPDYPTPTALTVAQAFQSAVPGAGAQPGVVSLPYLNWTANNTSFVKPAPGPSQTCPLTNWVNSNPLMLLAGAFIVAYFAGRPARRAA